MYIYITYLYQSLCAYTYFIVHLTIHKNIKDKKGQKRVNSSFLVGHFVFAVMGGGTQIIKYVNFKNIDDVHWICKIFKIEIGR